MNDALIYLLSSKNALRGRDAKTVASWNEQVEAYRRWEREYHPTLNDKIDIIVQYSKENVQFQGWNIEDVDGATWFIGNHIDAMMRAGALDNYDDIFVKCFDRYFETLYKLNNKSKEYLQLCVNSMSKTGYYAGCSLNTKEGIVGKVYTFDIQILKYGSVLDMYQCFPDAIGNIGKICVYGANRDEIIGSVRRRCALWGLKVDDISNEGDHYEISIGDTSIVDV